MAYWTEGIARVRVRPLVVDMAEGNPVGPAGALEVTWESTQADRWHQVYVNGCMAGVTAAPADRRQVVSGPVGGSGALGLVLVEVVAVDAADRETDLGGELVELEAEQGARVRLAWQAGLYLDANLESFDVFADGRTGTVDYEAPLNEAPIPARPGGQASWGYGCGGYGVGGYGQSAARYEWVTDDLEPGAWRFSVVAVDAAGNRLASAAEAAVAVSPVPRPPENFRVTGFDPVGERATLAWEASPDV